MTAIPTLQTERLVLRAPRLEDFEPFDAHDFARAIAGAGRENEAAA